GDASTGDEVVVRLSRLATQTKDAAGEIVDVTQRATRTFVGTYFERDGEALVRIDGTVFAHSIAVGDPGAKGAKPQDKVVIEMLRFPSPNERGEGVISEVLGPHGQPGIDTLSIIKAFGLPEEFPANALEEARQVASQFSESDLAGRTDFTHDLIVTIDPKDARDFDDAVSVTIDPDTNHWVLTVHIADVGEFAKPGGPLDTEARRRATSIYLPQKVIPMFPEVISNGLASLQEGKLRYVKTVRMEFTAAGQRGHVEFFNGAIRASKRYTYEEVQSELDAPPSRADAPRNTRVHPTPVAELALGDDLPHKGGCEKNRLSYTSPLVGEVAIERSEMAGGGRLVPPEPLVAPASRADALSQHLRRMRDLALLLRKKRIKRGALELTMPEAVL